MRKTLQVEEGDDLLLEVDAKGLHVRSIRQAVCLAQQIVARYVKPGRSLAAELIAERAARRLVQSASSNCWTPAPSRCSDL